jgi:hypothetical protein
MRYRDPEVPSRFKLERALEQNNVSLLDRMVVALALYGEIAFTQRLCQKLALHPHETVRGNAILGFGHLARRAKKLQSPSLRLIEAGLRDPSDYVRGQAWAAASDAAFFLKVRVAGYSRTGKKRRNLHE